LLIKCYSSGNDIWCHTIVVLHGLPANIQQVCHESRSQKGTFYISLSNVAKPNQEKTMIWISLQLFVDLYGKFASSRQG